MLKPSPREPLFNVPGTIIALLLVFAAVQVWRGLLSVDSDADVIARFAFVPVRMSALVDPAGVTARVASWGASASDALVQRADLARFFLQDLWPALPSLLTYAFLHGNWTHLALNGFWLLAFGSPVARRFGQIRFLAFMAITAAAGALTHWVCFPFGAEPVIGASAAVSGCMGAALRFAFTTTNRAAEDGAPAASIPPLTLVGVFRDRRSLSFLIVWFVTNALFGIGSTSLGMTDAPVAWQAHVGGFLAGLLLFVPFDPRRQVMVARQPEPEP